MRPRVSSLAAPVAVALLAVMATVARGQRTPTISYITAPDIYARIGGTIEMDCSVLYATEYPVLWVKLPSDCADKVRNNDIRNVNPDECTPIPLSSGSALIVRDNRFRYVNFSLLEDSVENTRAHENCSSFHSGSRDPPSFLSFNLCTLNISLPPPLHFPQGITFLCRWTEQCNLPQR